MADAERFELSVALATALFKSADLIRSTTHPERQRAAGIEPA